jgi:hypothetical protein
MYLFTFLFETSIQKERSFSTVPAPKMTLRGFFQIQVGQNHQLPRQENKMVDNSGRDRPL